MIAETVAQADASEGRLGRLDAPTKLFVLLVCAHAIAFALPAGLVRAVVLLPALYVPGLLLMSATVPVGFVCDKGRARSASVLLSILVLSLEAIMLDRAGIEIRRFALAAAQVGLSAICLFATRCRHSRCAPAHRTDARWKLREGLAAAAAIVVLAATGTLAVHAMSSADTPFGQMRLAGDWADIAGPVDVSVGQAVAVRFVYSAHGLPVESAPQLSAIIGDRALSGDAISWELTADGYEGALTVAAPAPGLWRVEIMDDRPTYSGENTLVVWLEAHE